MCTWLIDKSQIDSNKSQSGNWDWDYLRDAEGYKEYAKGTWITKYFDIKQHSNHPEYTDVLEITNEQYDDYLLRCNPGFTKEQLYKNDVQVVGKYPQPYGKSFYIFATPELKDGVETGKLRGRKGFIQHYYARGGARIEYGYMYGCYERVGYDTAFGAITGGVYFFNEKSYFNPGHTYENFVSFSRTDAAVAHLNDSIGKGDYCNG